MRKSLENPVFANGSIGRESHSRRVPACHGRLIINAALHSADVICATALSASSPVALPAPEPGNEGIDGAFDIDCPVAPRRTRPGPVWPARGQHPFRV